MEECGKHQCLSALNGLKELALSSAPHYFGTVFLAAALPSYLTIQEANFFTLCSLRDLVSSTSTSAATTNAPSLDAV
jgi:hypothetical protein